MPSVLQYRLAECALPAIAPAMPEEIPVVQVMFTITGEMQTDGAVNDIERTGMKIAFTVGLSQRLEQKQNRRHHIRRNDGIDGVRRLPGSCRDP